MTKKHFTKIAAALKESRPEHPDGYTLEVWKSTVRNLAYAFHEFNPNFDHNRFYAACGYND